MRSRHFTTQKNFKSSHTLGDLIGACVYGGSLTHVWMAKHPEIMVYLFSPFFYCGEGGGNTMAWYLFNFIIQGRKIIYLSEIWLY